MTDKWVAIGCVFAQFVILAVLILMDKRRREDNAATRASNERAAEDREATRAFYRLVVMEIRQHFPRFQEDVPDEEQFL